MNKITCVNIAIHFWLLFSVLCCISWKIGLPSPGGKEMQRQCRATQPAVHAGHFHVSINHQTLTWITGTLTP